MQQHMDLLGRKVEDKVTGFIGVVACVSYDLYGCVQAVVTPEADNKKHELSDSKWFDCKRLKVLDKKPVMELPSFEVAARIPGPESKPANRV